jgi:hypothetical protein
VDHHTDQRGELSPSAYIHRLIEIASPNPTNNGKRRQQPVRLWTEKEQIAARLKLHNIYRVQVKQVKQGKRQEINRDLLQWVTMCGRRLLAEPDPCAALAICLGRKDKRGKRAKNAVRDDDIALAVAKKMLWDGLTYDHAVLAVANKEALSFERVRQIYDPRSTEARARVVLSCLTTGGPIKR